MFVQEDDLTREVLISVGSAHLSKTTYQVEPYFTVPTARVMGNTGIEPVTFCL